MVEHPRARTARGRNQTGTMRADPRCFFFVSTVAVSALASGAGCATAPDPWFDRMVTTGSVEPTSEVERLALARMDELPPDAPVAIEGKRVVAGAAYVAASGRTCRTLRIEGSSASLACRAPRADEDEDERSAWFLAPDVFGPAPTETAATAEADAEARGVGAGAP